MFKIDFNAFLDSLSVMGEGMLIIFVAIVIVAAFVFALNFFTSKFRKNN